MIVKFRLGSALLCLLAAQMANAAQYPHDPAHRIQALEKEIREIKKDLAIEGAPDNLVRAHESEHVAKRLPHTEGGIIEQRELNPSAPDTTIITDNVLTYIAGTPVVTSPYLGKRSAFNASDLIVRISAVNLDLRILEQRQLLEDALKKMGRKIPEHPIIELSGKLEVGGFVTDPYVGNTTGDLNLNSMELITVTQIAPWVTGYVSLTYDNAPPAISGRRLNNSNVFLNKGFLTVGNLNDNPFYATFGQNIVPFGRYSSFMLSAPLTQLVGRTKARIAQLGVKYNGFFAQAYAFNGDTKAGAGGANIGYRFHKGDMIGEISGSVISNVAEAEQYQGTGGSGFTGFAATRATESVVNTVPAFNVQANFGYKNLSLLAEFTTASRHFNPTDLTYNGTGAKPRALNVEAANTFEFFKFPASIAVGYGWSDQALALNIARRRFIGAFNIAIWRDTIFSLEYRHDINYSAGDTAGGRGATGCAAGQSSCFVPVNTGGTLGMNSDTLTAQLGYYF